MKVIIAGGRDYELTADDFDWLDGVIPLNTQEVVHGAARGADTGADAWADSRGVAKKPFPVESADWRRLGKAAGPIRNRQMLDYAGADALVVLFPGGRGTADMRRQVLARGMRVVERDPCCGC